MLRSRFCRGLASGSLRRACGVCMACREVCASVCVVCSTGCPGEPHTQLHMAWAGCSRKRRVRRMQHAAQGLPVILHDQVEGVPGEPRARRLLMRGEHALSCTRGRLGCVRQRGGRRARPRKRAVAVQLLSAQAGVRHNAAQQEEGAVVTEQQRAAALGSKKVHSTLTSHSSGSVIHTQQC